MPRTLSEALEKHGVRLSPEAESLGVRYRPILLAQAEVRFVRAKYGLNTVLTRTALVQEVDRRGIVRWEDWEAEPVDERTLERGPLPQARFVPLEAPLTDGKALKALRRDFAEWVYRETVVTVRANPKLKVYAGLETSRAAFLRRCSEAAREKMEKELDKVRARYERKLRTLRGRLAREEQELAQDQAEYEQRKMEELGTHAENIFGLFIGRRRRLSTSLTKRRLTERAKVDVEESLQAIEQYKREIADLEREMEEALEEVKARWAEIVEVEEEIPVTPYKKDVQVSLFGVAWLPCYVLRDEERIVEAPAYG